MQIVVLQDARDGNSNVNGNVNGGNGSNNGGNTILHTINPNENGNGMM